MLYLRFTLSKGAELRTMHHQKPNTTISRPHAFLQKSGQQKTEKKSVANRKIYVYVNLP